jgi:hypothetical protein
MGRSGVVSGILGSFQCGAGLVFGSDPATLGIDGEAPSFLAYYHDGGGSWDVATGSAQDRIDILQIKIEEVSPAADPDPNSPVLAGEVVRDFSEIIGGVEVKTSQKFQKRRWTKATVSVKQGTPAAFPILPTVDTGYKLWGAVLVPALAAPAAIPAENWRDHRFPVGPKRIQMMGKDAVYPAAGWTLHANGDRITAGAGLANAYFILPEGHFDRRVIAIRIVGVMAAWSLIGLDTDTGTETVLYSFGPSGAGHYEHTVDLSFPVWCSATRSPGASPSHDIVLALKAAPSALGQFVHSVRFYTLGD